MYYSRRDPHITMNPRKTTGKHVDEFILNTCVYYPQATAITEEIYEKYARYCRDRGYQCSTFNVFARSFRYYVIHMGYVRGVGVFPCNYVAYKPDVGYVNKSGWSYSNLAVNY